MNKIEKLINETCLNSVEWKELGEIGKLIRGNGLLKKDLTENKDGVGCIHYGQIYTYYGNSANKTKSFISPELAKKLKKAQKEDVLITHISENIKDVCKPLAWLGDEICISGGIFAFRHNQNTRFITYILQTITFMKYKEKHSQGTNVIHFKADKILKFKIPVPPIKIQKKIVKILDKFNPLINDGLISLSTEFTARKKQYEYYLNNLLSFGDDVEWKELGEVCKILTGEQLNKTELKKFEKYPAYNGGTNYSGFTNKYNVDENTTIITRVGSAGFVQFVETKFWANSLCYYLKPNFEFVENKFLFYFVKNKQEYLMNSRHEGGIPSLKTSVISKIKIPILPLKIQKEIVEILDKFNALVNDISIVLSTEIAARKQQHEYYMNKLLGF